MTPQTRSARIAICMMFPFFILPLFLLLARRCRGRLVNVTIDDKFGDERTGAVPTYIPEGQWTNSGQAGAYRSTLHQRINDLPGNISIAFSGVRIYTFFAYWPASQVDLVFFLDGALTPTKRFTKPPYTGSDPLYWEFLMAFQSDTLDPGNHHLLVTSPGGPDTPLAFDYAIYTVDEPDPVDPDPPPTTTSTSPSSTIRSTASSGHDPERTTTTPASISQDTNTGSTPSPSHTPSSPVAPIAGSNTPVGAIAGAVSGAVLALLLVLLAVCWRRRRRTRRLDEAFADSSVQSGVTPFPARRDNTASIVPAPAFAGAIASEKKSHRTGDSLAPFLAYSDSEPSSSSNASASASARKYGFGKAGSSEPTTSDRAMSATGSEGTAFFRAELERVRAENARALREIEMLRQVAEPPPYSHTGAIER